MLPAPTTAALPLLKDAIQLGRIGLEMAQATSAGDMAGAAAFGGREGSSAVACYKHVLAVQLSHEQRDLRRLLPPGRRGGGGGGGLLAVAASMLLACAQQNTQLCLRPGPAAEDIVAAATACC